MLRDCHILRVEVEGRIEGTVMRSETISARDTRLNQYLLGLNVQMI